jgi:polysaccharide export outer membrane protein
MNSFKAACLACITLLFVTACASPRVFGDASQIEVTDLQQLPTPANIGVHRIGPQEVLEIEVLGSELLSGKFLTDGLGRIDYPLTGQLELNGTTPMQAARVVANNLRGEFVLDPQVRVIPQDIDKAVLSVGGEVKKPGNYPAEGGLTLMRAVNLAGGTGEYAKLDEVLIFRNIEGQDYIGVYNLKSIAQGNYADPNVYPNDVVMVGNSPSRRRIEDILQFIPVLSTAVVLIDRVGNRR